jgi:hypothetical protein
MPVLPVNWSFMAVSRKHFLSKSREGIFTKNAKNGRFAGNTGSRPKTPLMPNQLPTIHPDTTG